MTRVLAVGTCLLLLQVSAGYGLAKVLSGIEISPESQISVRISNPYDFLPPSGFVPLTVEIKNGSGASHTWLFHAMNQAMGPGITSSRSEQLTVPAGEARTFEVLAPIAPQGSGQSRYSNLVVSLAGHGVTNGVAMDYSSTRGSHPPLPFTGIGPKLAEKHWKPLQSTMEAKSSREVEGTELAPSDISTDWRALSGFSNLILDASEWRDLTEARRAAVLEWVIQGGRLAVLTDGNPAGLPTSNRIGMGEVQVWDSPDFQGTALKFLLDSGKPASEHAHEDYKASWPPVVNTGLPRTPVIALLIFVVIFGLLVGPINFRVFAPPGARHRLFVTTPVISVAASILLGLIIVLSEGFGGRGQAVAATLIHPELHRSVVWQEQVSRSGVLLGSAFKEPPGSVVLPLDVRRESRNRHSDRRRPASYNLVNGNWDGSWFRSRNTQAQLVRAVTPSRERLEVRVGEDGIPSATSNFLEPLREVWWVDGSGIVWRADSLQPGETRLLERAGHPELQAWMARANRSAGPVIRDVTKRFLSTDLAGKFVAIAPSTQVTPTLPSIRWEPADRITMGTASASSGRN